MTFSIGVKRDDTATSGLVEVEVALARYNATSLATVIPAGIPETFEYPNSTYVLVGEAGTGEVYVTLSWYEDGIDPSPVMPANATWIPGAIAAIAPGSANTVSDSNTNDKSINSTFTVNAWTMSNPDGSYEQLVGDLKGEGYVNILDAILLSDTFGLSPGQTGYNPACAFTLVLGPTINILDAIVLADHFSWYWPFPGVPAPAGGTPAH
jgi:hypothetical protein